ncbi:MAG: hypothetical protein QOC55_2022, partial [Thermoleophilaceae bacterium]|nr:hypothetical protein [Thermoleophilaceae bacterium]
MRSETLQTSVDGEADASAQEPRPARRRPPPLRVGLAAGVAGGVLLSVLLAVLTADVAPVVAVVLGVTVAAYAGRIGWRMS